MWKDLSMGEKAALMKIAVNSGIHSIDDIVNTYNEYANGGYKPSDSIKKRISTWEGSSMKTNRSFDAEAKDFNASLPQGATSRLSQQQLDGLYSYSYNVGAGNFRKRVKPVLSRYLQGKATSEDVQKAMWASKDNQLRGLAKRRNVERAMFGNGKVAPLSFKNNYPIRNNAINNYALSDSVNNIIYGNIDNMFPVEEPTETYIPPLQKSDFTSILDNESSDTNNYLNDSEIEFTNNNETSSIYDFINSVNNSVPQHYDVYKTFAEGGELDKKPKSNSLGITLDTTSLDAPTLETPMDEIGGTLLSRPVEDETSQPYLKDNNNFSVEPSKINLDNIKTTFPYTRNNFQEAADFYKDDYLYRLKKARPNVTQQDVDDAFNAISTKPYEGLASTAKAGYSRDYNSIILPTKRDMESDYNTEDLVHEYSHGLDAKFGLSSPTNDELFHNLSDSEIEQLRKRRAYDSNLLNNAYTLKYSGQESNLTKRKEQRAVNTELREAIQKQAALKGKKVTREGLDKYIDALPSEDLLKAIESLNTGYTEGMDALYLKYKEKDIKKALKEVAFNNYNNNITGILNG